MPLRPNRKDPRLMGEAAVEPADAVPSALAPASGKVGAAPAFPPFSNSEELPEVRAESIDYASKHLECPSCNSDQLVLVSAMLICRVCGYQEGCCE